MIRVVTVKRLRDLTERAARLAVFEAEQSAAVEALAVLDRKARRRAHRALWSGLPR